MKNTYMKGELYGKIFDMGMWKVWRKGIQPS